MFYKTQTGRLLFVYLPINNLCPGMIQTFYDTWLTPGYILRNSEMNPEFCILSEIYMNCARRLTFSARLRYFDFSGFVFSRAVISTGPEV